MSDNTVYRSADGHVMQREQGETPNGNSIGGRWVLRDPNGNWLGVDQYRNDLAPCFGFEFVAGTNELKPVTASNRRPTTKPANAT